MRLLAQGQFGVAAFERELSAGNSNKARHHTQQ